MNRTPQILIFDMDSVLVDVGASYHRTIVETVCHFTGRRPSRNEIHLWKNRSGYNDDWKLTFDWIRSLGIRAQYDEVKRQFQRLYRGRNFDGYMDRERWLFNRLALRRLTRRFELAIFTGRPRREALYTLNKFAVRPFFGCLVGMEDVARPKPDAEGLRRILDGRDPAGALYIGDNRDDALAARRAQVPFVGVLPRNSTARRLRVAQLRQLGAQTVLGSVNELEKWLA